MEPGQVRDQESALDWFNVRYYSGAEGRFQSPDPANAGADPSNPQSWNGYAYVGNNPLSYTDPSGMFGEATAGGCAFGPEGCAIGAVVDIGIALAGLFEGLFGGGGPSADGATRSLVAKPGRIVQQRNRFWQWEYEPIFL